VGFIREVFLSTSLERTPYVEGILRRLSGIPQREVADPEALREEVLLRNPDPIKEGKSILFISNYPGELVKGCPGTKGHICCGYRVINLLVGCPMDCTYCILQSYINNPYIALYPQIELIFDRVRKMVEATPDHVLRFGTGELSDSLALDDLVGFSREAIPFFASLRKALLELKTKAARVDHLLRLEHKGRTVLAWSLNPERIVLEEESGTAPLEHRLSAARLCQGAGYPLAFHFDPIIEYPGWEEDYRRLIEALARQIDPSGVIWISMGCLRFPPPLKGIITERFPRSRVLLGELFPAEDGKFRYLKPLRIQIYRKVLGWLREWDEGLFVYLCMERDDVWREVFGKSPGSTAGLVAAFDERVREFFRRW